MFYQLTKYSCWLRPRIAGVTTLLRERYEKCCQWNGQSWQEQVTHCRAIRQTSFSCLYFSPGKHAYLTCQTIEFNSAISMLSGRLQYENKMNIQNESCWCTEIYFTFKYICNSRMKSSNAIDWNCLFRGIPITVVWALHVNYWTGYHELSLIISQITKTL